MPDRMSDRMPEGMPDKVPECLPDRMPDRVPEDMPENIAEDMPGRMPEDMPDRMPEDMPDKMPEDMSDSMPEDLPATKRINVMVGITRRKVFFCMQEPAGQVPAQELQTKVHGPTWMHGGAPQPSTPAAIDLSKLCEPRSHLWAQHCSAIGCPSWIWCNRTHDSATWIRCGRPWVRSFMEKGHGLHQATISKEAMTKPWPMAPRPMELVTLPCTTRMSGHIIQWPCQRLQCVGKRKKGSSFLTSGVSKLPQHLLHVHCFGSTNFGTHCFWHATWIASILAPNAFGLAPIAFHTCKPCMLHGHVAFDIERSAFGMTYLLPICFCAPTFLPVRCNHTMDNELNEWLLHGNPKQISMSYIQPNPMDLFYVVARIIIIAITCTKSCTIFLPG